MSEYYQAIVNLRKCYFILFKKTGEEVYKEKVEELDDRLAMVDAHIQ